MRSAPAQLLSDLRDGFQWRRVATLSLVIALHILLMYLLLRLAPPPPFKRDTGMGPLTVELLPEQKAEKETPAKARRARSAATRPARTEVDARPAPVADPSSIWQKVLPLTRDELAAADISKMPSPSNDSAQDTETASASGGGGGGGAASGGDGPNGERLYDADWYRRPTHAELAAYMPANGARIGWGMIACRTVKGNRVEDCQEIGQYPAGSGLAGAVRQAAWQFRVLPPRIGGRPVIGAWVRIRIEYTERGVN